MNTKQKFLAGATALALVGGGLYLAFATASFSPDALNQPAGYVGQPAVTSTNVKDGQQQMFLIDYASQDWSGNLHSYDISSTGSASDTDNWDGGAQGQIDGQNWDTGRKIVTLSDAATPAGIAFRWDSLSTTQKGLLDSGTLATATSSPILNYVRGDASNQMADAVTTSATGNNYRYRAHKLGDIIHSTPVYCSASDCGSATVFVGANDGMLHAINAIDGTESFAYVPSMLLSKLKNLTTVAYTHNYFVDGRIAVWKIGSQTILAGALGAGGKGLFGLDVTNAAPASESAAASKVLWEISNTTSGFADLGNVYGQPKLEKVQTGASTNVPALVVGNGYNNTGTGTAVLYLINPATGALLKKIDTGSGSAGSPNGLSTPTLYASGTYGTGVYDTAYAGDIDGNLWKFDLVAGTATKLFTVDTSPVQAITVAPGVMKHSLGGAMVTFATGRLFTTTDKADTASHYVYGIWDKPGATTAVTTSELLTQTLTEASYTGTSPSTRVRRATSNTPNWTDGHNRGWKTGLPVSGERMVSDGAYITSDGVFQFMTVNPTVNTTEKPYGESWWMQLNPMTGGDNGRTLMDLNGDGLFTTADKVTVSSTAYDPVGRQMAGSGRSQLVGLSTSSLDVYQGNYDKNDWPDQTVAVTTTTVSRGVSGGHFDFDIFCNYYSADNVSHTSCSGNSTGSASGSSTYLRYVHIHEYDDIYDRTGVDMINPSVISDRLENAVGSNVTRTVGTPVAVAEAAVAGTVVKYATGKDVSASSQPLNRTSNFSTFTKESTTEEDGYPTTSFTTLANGSVEEAVVDKSTTVTITPTREYTDGTYYTNAYGRKRYYTFVDGTKSSVTTTTTTKVTYSFSGALTGFKVLVSNQAYSPAVELTIGGEGTTPVKAYDYQTANNLHEDVNNFPSYTMQTLRYLKFNLPVTGFESKDWGTGIVRAGLHPTVPDCVFSGSGPKKGPSGEWRNGALTIQIVKDNVTNSDIRLNVAGKPELGYVLKESIQGSKLIAEYSAYWHAPIHSVGENTSLSPHVNGGWCMGETKNGVVMWRMNPPQDTAESDATEKTPTAGSSDPRVGSYGLTSSYVGDCSISASASCTVTSTITTITTTTNASTGVKTTVTVTVRTYSDNSSSTTTTTTSVGTGTGIGTAQYNRQNVTLGRVNWREFQR